MQFHLNGVKGSSDPLKLQYTNEKELDFQSSLPAEVDVLIVGAGPAGHLLAAQLAQFPEITTRLIESKPGRLEQGQADGLQCRSLEIFEAFGFAEKVLKESYWVNETTFWSPDEAGQGLRRSGRIRDTEDGLSEMPHVILNQARLHDFWLEAMKWSPTRLEPSYNRKMEELKLPKSEGDPSEVTILHGESTRELVRAKFVVGCDGGRSNVRKALGLEMRGDSMNQAWGILDALIETTFPDIRLKSVIHSANEGSILIIPREGGYLVRFYVELGKLERHERIASRNIQVNSIIDRATRIFHPYTFDVKQIAYWSVYEVGQRLTDHFDNVLKSDNNPIEETPRVFVTGDACHTHSAKAGQGMNVSMNDSFNLAWKLAMVLKGTASPQILHTYSFERHAVAQALIDFDREISPMFAAKPQLNAKPGDTSVVDPAVFQATFQRQGRFTAGVETHYPPGLLTQSDTSHQHLATGFTIGMRFHSCQVVRFADAKPVQLGHQLKADGRWRILLFATALHDPRDFASPLAQVCTFVEKMLLPCYTPDGADIDSVIDIRAVLPHTRASLDGDITALPSLLLPRKGVFGLLDYEKVFVDEPSYNFGFGDLYVKRGIDRGKGCMLLVRPDQYVSAVLPLSLHGCAELETFLGRFMLAQR